MPDSTDRPTPLLARWWTVSRNVNGDELARWGPYKSRETAEYVRLEKVARYGSGITVEEATDAE